METPKKKNIEFIPVFERSFLKPKYWGSWLAIGALAGMALLPAKVRIRCSDGWGEWRGNWLKALAAAR